MRGTSEQRTNMNAPKVTPPVLLCRLCHCEFTNFREHVKSLVHLEAREVKSSLPPPPKSKRSGEPIASDEKKKRIDKVEQNSRRNSEEVTIIEEHRTCDNKIDLSAETVVLDDSFDSVQHCAPGDFNGNEDSQMYDPYAEEEEDVPEDDKTADNCDTETAFDKKLAGKEKQFLENSWYCKLCAHVDHKKDQSFDEHALDKNHQMSVSARIKDMRLNRNWKVGNQWLLKCWACTFQTNEKELFIAHLESPLHNKNVDDIMGKPISPKKPVTNNNQSTKGSKSLKVAEEANKDTSNKTKLPELSTATGLTAASSSSTSSAVQNVCTTVEKKSSPPAKSANNKSSTENNPSTNQANKNPLARHQNKNLPARSPVEKPQGNGGLYRNKRNTNPRNKPQALMSLSIPPALNKAVWSTSTVASDPPASVKPGILGEYKPEYSHSMLNKDAFLQPDRFVRPADSLTQTGLGSSIRRSNYSEINCNTATVGAARTFELDSYRNLLSSDNIYSSRLGLNSFASEGKLNPTAFSRMEQEPPSRQFETWSNLLSQQRSGMLPSVSLDLASNSSFRSNYESDRAPFVDDRAAFYDDRAPFHDDFSRLRPDSSRLDVSRGSYSRPNPWR